MADFSFDFSELDRLAADLENAGRGVRPNVRKATEVTARKIKDRWKAKLAAGGGSLKHLPRAVSYDVDTTRVFGVDVVEAEIGPDPSKTQGRLDNISEFGTPTVAPRGYGLASLEENQADYVRGIEMAADETLTENGL